MTASLNSSFPIFSRQVLHADRALFAYSALYGKSAMFHESKCDSSNRINDPMRNKIDQISRISIIIQRKAINEFRVAQQNEK